MSEPELYFRQLLSGRDFATADPVAQQMVNFAYVIGDRSSGDVVLIDPAYAVDELIDIVEADGMRVSGVLATHYHADHVGGTMRGHTIDGIGAAIGRCGCPVHVQREESPWVQRTTGVSATDLVEHAAGDIVEVGGVPITLLHTPGHTPGSQCFLVDGRLISGDTLFLNGCGRTDFPGSDPNAMYDSLQLLATLPADTVLYPGHLYSEDPSAALGDVVEHNVVFKPPTRESWLHYFGGP